MNLQLIAFIVLLLFLVLLLALFIRGRSRASDLDAVVARIAAIKAEPGDITPIDCPLPLVGETIGETADCFIYTVPVNYNDPDSGTINLTVVRLRAQSDSPLTDPVIFLAGGPGQSGVVSGGGSLYEDLRRDRDILFPAQRGTLFGSRLALEECVALLAEQLSRSELNEFAKWVSERGELDTTLPYETYVSQYGERTGHINARCHEAFEKAGLDPTQFNTANSARDLAGLMAALDYDSYNLHGTSYGTRLALETMRRHPDAPIRSVVLDSPAAPTTDRLVTLATATHTALEQLLANCEADPACNDAYPDLLDRTVALIAKLEAEPLTAGNETIGAKNVLTQLTDLSGTRAGYLPRMIAELEAGDATTYLALRDGTVGLDQPEGPLVSRALSNLVQRLSAAGIRPGNPFAGLQVVKQVLDAVVDENPREAMKAAAEAALPESGSLPTILNDIDNLSADDIASLQAEMAAAPPPTDAAALALVTDAQARNDAFFMQNGIVCLEKLRFEDVASALAARDALPIPALGLPDIALATEIGNCTNYPMGETDPAYYEPVTSAVPVLILQGEFDTRTPPVNARVLAEQLANATLVVVPQKGHETWGSGNCAARIGSAFIRNPEQTLDLSCLEQRRIRFSLPGEPLDVS